MFLRSRFVLSALLISTALPVAASLGATAWAQDRAPPRGSEDKRATEEKGERSSAQEKQKRSSAGEEEKRNSAGEKDKRSSAGEAAPKPPARPQPSQERAQPSQERDGRPDRQQRPEDQRGDAKANETSRGRGDPKSSAPSVTEGRPGDAPRQAKEPGGARRDGEAADRERPTPPSGERRQGPAARQPAENAREPMTRGEAPTPERGTAVPTQDRPGRTAEPPATPPQSSMERGRKEAPEKDAPPRGGPPPAAEQRRDEPRRVQELPAPTLREESGAPTARPSRDGVVEDRARPDASRPGADGQRRGGSTDVMQEVRRERRERVEDGRTIIEEPGRRTIVRDGDRLIIQQDETERLRRRNPDARVERAPDGVTRTIVVRPNGVRVITEVDEYGRLLRRVRRDVQGREVILLENAPARRGRWEQTIIEAPPPEITIPRERYIRDVRRSSPREVLETFEAPPVQRIERRYSIEEVRRSPNLLARMPRVDVDTVTFDFGSWTLEGEQIELLQIVADGIAKVIERNPNEIFLVEGHTDAVGSDIDNLSLSDRRAETVAMALSERFGVPAENLVSQGFGEAQLKVQTDEPERANRRVTIRRITPLLQGRNDAR